MIENLGGVTSQLVQLALDASLLRHQVNANNIANADTPGYQAQRLSFADYLSRFSTLSIDKGSDAQLRSEVESLRQRLNHPDSLIESTGASVQLDQEMVELTENVLRYRALIEANGKRGQLLKMAISERRI